MDLCVFFCFVCVVWPRKGSSWEDSRGISMRDTDTNVYLHFSENLAIFKPNSFMPHRQRIFMKTDEKRRFKAIESISMVGLAIVFRQKKKNNNLTELCKWSQSKSREPEPHRNDRSFGFNGYTDQQREYKLFGHFAFCLLCAARLNVYETKNSANDIKLLFTASHCFFLSSFCVGFSIIWFLWEIA